MTQPRIYCALSFSDPTTEGVIPYVAHYVAATTFREAEESLRAENCVGPETYLLSDEAVRRGPAVRTVNGTERHLIPTLTEHAAWVQAMTEPCCVDGDVEPATYIRLPWQPPVFTFDGAEYGLADMLQANADDTDLCLWLSTAKLGDSFASVAGPCVRTA